MRWSMCWLAPTRTWLQKKKSSTYPDVRWRCHVSTSLMLKIQKEDKRLGEEGKEVDCGFSHCRITLLVRYPWPAGILSVVLCLLLSVDVAWWMVLCFHVARGFTSVPCTFCGFLGTGAVSDKSVARAPGTTKNFYGQPTNRCVVARGQPEV